MALSSIAMLVVAYGGLYLLNLNHERYSLSGSCSGNFVHTTYPIYHVGGQSATVFFGPAHRVDRLLRRGKWWTKRWNRKIGRSAENTSEAERTPAPPPPERRGKAEPVPEGVDVAVGPRG
ncbi:hypothetical protein ACFL59_11875 [Planctomycetota bacterium]